VRVAAAAKKFVVVLAGLALLAPFTARAALPEPAKFIAEIDAGRLDPESFDFTAAGYWQLPVPERQAWFSGAMMALDLPNLKTPPCAALTQSRWRALIWMQMLNQVPDAAAWSKNFSALRTRVAEFDRHIDELGTSAPQPGVRPNVNALLARAARDQAARSGFEPRWTQDLPSVAAGNWLSVVSTRMGRHDCVNTEWLRAEIAKIGWFDIPTYGAAADDAAWLLTQHADLNPDFQREVLAKLHALPAGSTSQKNLAFLHDRVAGADGKPQRYGTQGNCQPDGSWQPKPSEDPERLDERRKSLGLAPIAEHALRMRQNCSQPTP
jgi:hypothetical protein